MQELIDVMRPPAGAPPGPGGGLNFGPVVDGRSLPSNPFDPTAPGQSASVPFLTGTTATEITFFLPDERLQPLDDTAFKARVKDTLKVDDADADRMIALYRKNQPGRDNIDLMLRLETDASFFRGGVETAGRTQGGAEGRAGVRLPFRVLLAGARRTAEGHALHGDSVRRSTTSKRARSTPAIGPVAQKLADQMSAAWVAFARTGNPSHKGMAAWTPWDPDKRATMVFGPTATALVNDPGREERVAIKAIRDAAQPRSSAE